MFIPRPVDEMVNIFNLEVKIVYLQITYRFSRVLNSFYTPRIKIKLEGKYNNINFYIDLKLIHQTISHFFASITSTCINKAAEFVCIFVCLNALISGTTGSN